MTLIFALKRISHHWDASYEELTRLVNVPMLSKRRLHLKLAQVYKTVHGLCDFLESIFQIQLAHCSRLAKGPDTTLSIRSDKLLLQVVCTQGMELTRGGHRTIQSFKLALKHSQ